MSGICFQVTWGLGGDVVDSCWLELTGGSVASLYSSFKFCTCLKIFTVQYFANNKIYKQGSVLDFSRLQMHEHLPASEEPSLSVRTRRCDREPECVLPVSSSPTSCRRGVVTGGKR